MSKTNQKYNLLAEQNKTKDFTKLNLKKNKAEHKET